MTNAPPLVCSMLCLTLMGGCDSGSDADGGTTHGEEFGDTATLLMGDLGDLGPIENTVSSVMIENSGETLIYLSSVSLVCAQLEVSRWLGDLEPGSQVVEIVVPSERATGSVPVELGGAEVNFAAGGMSSAYETAATGGRVTFTQSEPESIVVGTVVAEYADSGESVRGRFRATYCAGGQGY